MVEDTWGRGGGAGALRGTPPPPPRPAQDSPAAWAALVPKSGVTCPGVSCPPHPPPPPPGRPPGQVWRTKDPRLFHHLTLLPRLRATSGEVDRSAISWWESMWLLSAGRGVLGCAPMAKVPGAPSTGRQAERSLNYRHQHIDHVTPGDKSTITSEEIFLLPC